MTKHDPLRPELVMDTIAVWQRLYGHPPSVREIIERTGIPLLSTVHYYLRKLTAAGRLVQCGCGCGRYWLA